MGELPKGYLRIAGDWSYAPLRVGLSLRAPNGTEAYFQPGDDENAIRDTIEALDDIPAERQEIVAEIAFSEYFA